MTAPPGDPWAVPAGLAPEPPEPPPPGYGYGPPPGYGYPRASNGMGVTSLVLGIVGLLLSFFGVGIFLTVLAIIFGVVGRGKARRNEATNGSTATAGMVLGILGTVVASSVLIVGLGAAKYDECLRKATTDIERFECERYR